MYLPLVAAAAAAAADDDDAIMVYCRFCDSLTVIESDDSVCNTYIHKPQMK